MYYINIYMWVYQLQQESFTVFLQHVIFTYGGSNHLVWGGAWVGGLVGGELVDLGLGVGGVRRGWLWWEPNGLEIRQQHRTLTDTVLIYIHIFIYIYIFTIHTHTYIVEGSLEVKLPTIWTDESRAGKRQREEKD